MADFEVNRRLKFLIKNHYKVTPFAFSQKYTDKGGVKTSQVMRERNGLSSKLLEQILEAYPEINRGWLLTGEGDMLKSEEKTPQIFTSEKEQQLLSIIESQQRTIEILSKKI